MGSWGYEPKDGDSAQDIWLDTQRCVSKELEKLFNSPVEDSYDRWSRVGALQMALESGLWIKHTILSKAIIDCQEALDDDDFMESWRDPGTAALSISNSMMAFNELVAGAAQGVADVSLSELDRDTLLPGKIIEKIRKMEERVQKSIRARTQSGRRRSR